MEEITQEVAMEVDSTTAAEGSLNVGMSEEMLSIKDKLKCLPGVPLGNGSNHATILRVPAWLKERNKELYEPKVVSIGPYNCYSEFRRIKEEGRWYSLAAMEEEKWYSLRDFLSRNPDHGIEAYINAMKLLESEARGCYSKDIKLDHHEFIQMLLLDGCFILEFYLKAAVWQFTAKWDTNAVISDIYLLENQIPFFVLHKLFVIYGGCRVPNCSFEYTCPLIYLILKCPPSNFNNRQWPNRLALGNNINHLVDLFYRVQLPNGSRKKIHLIPRNSLLNGFGPFGGTEADIWTSTQPSVSELQKAGVLIKRRKNARYLLEVSFHKGILEMPFFKLSRDTKIILVNMIAFEQTRVINLAARVFTGYVAFMDSLINTEKDVSILKRSGVFKNMLESDNEAANFFNELGSQVPLDCNEHMFVDLMWSLKKYSDSISNRYLTRLLNDISTNPWTLISVLTGAIALILTFIQTYYAAAPKQ